MNAIDTDIFYWINSHHTPVTDWLMWGFSQWWSWLAVLLLVVVFVTLRREPRRSWVVILGIVLCFLFADQLSANIFKPGFCRLRPGHALPDVSMFHTR